MQDLRYAGWFGEALAFLTVSSSSGGNEMQATNAHAIGKQGTEVRPVGENARQFHDALSRCWPSFQRSAFRHLGNAADAEDAVQDALLSAYKHLDQFQGG